MSDTISKISSGGIVYPVEDETARKETASLFEDNDALYEGRDLTQIFALEISQFTDAWAWIKNRIANANYTGIHVGDYIPMMVGSERHEMQVAGIDTYYRTTDNQLGHHIDFISRDCYSQTVQWNTTNNNNGNATSACPYLVSNLKTFLDTLYESLPSAVKNVITNKRFLLEQRYSASGALTDSTSWSWENMGKLWVPTEYEVFDSVVWGTKGYSAMQAVQYPIFRNSWKNRIKGAGPKGSRCDWWLASVGSGGSTNACDVGNGGSATDWGASGAFRVPLCFRITAQAA